MLSTKRLIVLGCALLGCSNSGSVDVVRPPDDGADAADDAATDSGPDGTVTDGGPEDAAEEPPDDAPLASVELGVIPIGVGADGGAPGPSARIMAHLETIAAGSRGVSLIHRWDELYTSPNDPRADAWAELAELGPLYAQADRALLLSIGVVDRLEDARPPGAEADWYALANRQAMEALVDRTWATFGDELRYLVIGREVDRWLATQDGSQRSAFVEFARYTLDYARRHPDRPAGTQVGVAASLEGWVAGSPELDDLRAASDVVVATYYPVDARWNARAPTSAGPDLDDLLGALGVDAGPATVVLQEVGYPSSEQNGSSPGRQRQFYEGLLQALRARRAQLPFVSLFALGDPDRTACEHAAAAFGMPGDALAISGWCSLGLRDPSGAPKDAWAAVSGALADFALP